MVADRVERVTLKVPSDLRFGEAVRGMLDVLTSRLEVETGTENLRNHVISAFSEAFNNVVEHAYRGSRTEAVDMELEIASDRLVLRLADSGRGFEVDSVEDPDLASLPEGGLGLWIIKSLMTRMDYERGETNVLTMVKDFSSPLAFRDDDQEEL